MAFSNKNLSVIAYANGFTLWHYKSTTDASATVLGTGYFNSIASIANAGDMILLNASDANSLINISTIASGVVTVADLLA